MTAWGRGHRTSSPLEPGEVETSGRSKAALLGSSRLSRTDPSSCAVPAHSGARFLHCVCCAGGSRLLPGCSPDLQWEVLREDPRGDLSQATGEEEPQPPVLCPPCSCGWGAVGGGRDPRAPPPWEELQRVPPPGILPVGLPFLGSRPSCRYPLCTRQCPQMVSVLRPCRLGRPAPQRRWGAPRGVQLLLVFVKTAGGQNVVLGWPGWSVTHFGSLEMSFHLRSLQQRGGEVALSTEGCGFVDGAAVVSVAGLLCGREERGP